MQGRKERRTEAISEHKVTFSFKLFAIYMVIDLTMRETLQHGSFGKDTEYASRFRRSSRSEMMNRRVQYWIVHIVETRIHHLVSLDDNIRTVFSLPPLCQRGHVNELQHQGPPGNDA